MLVEQIPGEPCSFFVIPYSDPRNQIKFVARTRYQKRLWAHHIKAVMLEDLNIPNRAKDLVFQLGDEDDVPLDKSIKKWGQTSTPDYLERRHRYRRSEIKDRAKAKAARDLLLNSSSHNTSITANPPEAPKDPFSPCCADEKTCNCAEVKKELREGMLAKQRRDSVTSAVIDQTPLQQAPPPPPINKYTTNSMPRRILNLKKTRSKTVPSSVFYATLGEFAADLSDSVHDEGSSMADSQEQLLIPSSSGGSQDAQLNVEEERDEKKSRPNSTALSLNMHKSGTRDPSIRANKSSAFRASDSHLNYNKVSMATAALMRSHTISSSSSSTTTSSTTNLLISSHKKLVSKKNNSSLYKSFRSVREEDSGSLSSIHHHPGSSNLGERIANVDYVDPQRLFCLNKRKSEVNPIDKTKTPDKQHNQRDSVVSVTSSSDSVDEGKVVPGNVDSAAYDRIMGDDYYEDNIERCLEDATLFRDSAIYSDDNDLQRGRLTRSSSSCGGGAAAAAAAGEQPPPVPYKPKHVTQLQQKKLQELANRRLERTLSGGASPGTITANRVPASTPDGRHQQKQPSFLFNKSSGSSNITDI